MNERLLRDELKARREKGEHDVIRSGKIVKSDYPRRVLAEAWNDDVKFLS